MSKGKHAALLRAGPDTAAPRGAAAELMESILKINYVYV